MAANYMIRVRCCNCGVFEDRVIVFGTEVGQEYCNNCGCKSLRKATAETKI